MFSSLRFTKQGKKMRGSNPVLSRAILNRVPEVSKVRSRDLREVLIGYLLILVIVWLPNPAQRILFWVAFAWIIYVTATSRQSWDDLGLRFSLNVASLLRAALLISAAVLLAGMAVVIAIKFHTLHELYGNAPPGEHMWGYMIWAFMQQFILQTYFLARLMRLLPSRTLAVFTAAAMFASAHLPNPLLTAATFLWGAAACALFMRYRNLYSLGAIHAVLGLCVAFTVPNAVHHHMRVGLGYLRYHHDYPGKPSAPAPSLGRQKS
jgi:hypothetical protein